MGGEDDATVATVLTDNVPSESSREGVHAGGWFVKEHGLAVAAECNGNGELALHATAEILGERVALLVQGDVFDALVDLLFGFLGGHFVVHSLDPGEELDVFPDGEHGEEAVVLQADADLLSNGGHVGTDVPAADGCVSLRRSDHTGQHADRGGLSCAVVSEQGGDLVSVQRHAESVDGSLLSEGLAEVADLDALALALLCLDGVRNLLGWDAILVHDLLVFVLVRLGIDATWAPVALGEWEVPWERLSEFEHDDTVGVPGEDTPKDAVDDEVVQGVGKGVARWVVGFVDASRLQTDSSIFQATDLVDTVGECCDGVEGDESDGADVAVLKGCDQGEEVSAEEEQESHQGCLGGLGEEGRDEQAEDDDRGEGEDPEEENVAEVRVFVEAIECERCDDGGDEMEAPEGQEPGPTDVGFGDTHHLHELLLAQFLLLYDVTDHGRDGVEESQGDQQTCELGNCFIETVLFVLEGWEWSVLHTVFGNEEAQVLGALGLHDPIANETLDDQGAIVDVLVGAAGFVHADLRKSVVEGTGVRVIFGVTFEALVGGRGGDGGGTCGFFGGVEVGGVDADAVVVVDIGVGQSIEDDGEGDLGRVSFLVVAGFDVALQGGVAVKALHEIEGEWEVDVGIGLVELGVTGVDVFSEVVGLLLGDGVVRGAGDDAKGRVLAEFGGIRLAVFDILIALRAVALDERDLPVESVIVHSADAEFVAVDAAEEFGRDLVLDEIRKIQGALEEFFTRKVGDTFALGLQRLDVVAEGVRDDALIGEGRSDRFCRKAVIAFERRLDGEKDRDESDGEGELKKGTDEVALAVDEVAAHQGAEGTGAQHGGVVAAAGGGGRGKRGVAWCVGNCAILRRGRAEILSLRVFFRCACSNSEFAGQVGEKVCAIGIANVGRMRGWWLGPYPLG
mmetsp:Transcript_23468/g.65508  ORF Transcript_23468/g.65508 Transcript_23468/m.65508 type:complete len:907 (-) Transcript_23468:80-2800(-)